MFLPEVVNAFPVFSYGEGYIDDKLSKFSFDQEGMKQLQNWCDGLTERVWKFLLESGLGKTDASILWSLHMSSIWEKVDRIESAYGLYQSMMALPTPCISNKTA